MFERLGLGVSPAKGGRTGRKTDIDFPSERESSGEDDAFFVIAHHGFAYEKSMAEDDTKGGTGEANFYGEEGGSSLTTNLGEGVAEYA